MRNLITTKGAYHEPDHRTTIVHLERCHEEGFWMDIQDPGEEDFKILADRMPWQPVFWITAAFMLPGLLCTLVIKEPRVYGAPPKTMREAVVLPFSEFIARGG